MKNNEGIIITGGQFHANQVATGKGATIYHNQESIVDYDKLSDELTTLRTELSKRAQTPEEYISVSKVAQAEQAVKAKDSTSALTHLKEAGKWILEVAKEIGVDVITDMLKKNI